MAQQNGSSRATPNRRRDRFIKKWLQMRIILVYVAILLGGAAGLAYYTYLYSRATLRHEIFSNHSAYQTIWETLREGILTANIVAAAIVLWLAVVLTLYITWSVSRSAGQITDNIKATFEKGLESPWEPVKRIHEFKHLQKLLSYSLEQHRERIAELSALSGLLEEKIRDARTRIETPGPISPTGFSQMMSSSRASIAIPEVILPSRMADFIMS